MSFIYEVKRAQDSAYRALSTLNQIRWNEDPRSAQNTYVLNDAHREIVQGALPAATQAQFKAGYERIHPVKVGQVSTAIQHLTDATWELTSFSKYGGQDVPNPSGAKWQIERGLDLLRQADDRWSGGNRYPAPGPYRPGPVYPNPYPGPVFPNPYPRPGRGYYRGPRVPSNTGGNSWTPGSGRPTPRRW